MKKFLRTFTAFVAVTMAVLTASADIPPGYYNGIAGLKDGQLKTAISEITRKFTITSDYSTVYSNLPNSFRLTDTRPNTSYWWDMYSNIDRNNRSFSGMNREHAFPKSWWGGATNIPAYIDLNHLYPADGPANMAKSNYPMGIVDRQYNPTFNNGVTKVGYPVSGQGGGAGLVFEPADEYKGDFARTYFYMATTYQYLTWKYTFMVQQNLFPTLSPWAAELLVQWARQDPVSQKEIDRNEAVYKIQNNRNPFIDFPDLFEYLWGNKVGQPFNPGSAPVVPSGDPVLVSPVQDMALDFGQVAEGDEVTAQLYFHGEYLTAPLDVIISKRNSANPEMFELSSTSISPTLVNSKDGYWFNIVYRPTSLGVHTARVVVSEGGLSGSLGVELRGECLPVPTLSRLVATNATDVTSDSYKANWDVPEGEVVDYYVVTRTMYVGGTSSQEEIIADENELVIDGFNLSDSESYSVQSVRLNHRSEPSNVIFVDHSGIGSVAADSQPLAIRPIPGGFLVSCSAPQTDLRIIDVAGRIVDYRATVAHGEDIQLPLGVYLITTAEHPAPLRIAVR